jgi:molecular chaperone Hsp33
VRAVARFSGTPSTLDLRELSGHGTLTVTVEGDDVASRYQGVVPLTGERMSDCLREYFESSEQLPTRLWLRADAAQTSGLLLQRLPVTSRPTSATESGTGGVSEEEIEDAWNRVQLVAGTVTGPELAELTDRELLKRLFAEDDVRMFETAPVFFRCSCSRERVATMLRSLGREEVDSILAERGSVEVRCEFCSRSYRFDAVDAGAIFIPAPDASRSGVH